MSQDTDDHCVGSLFTIYRNGVLVTDTQRNLDRTDTGLTAGTIYTYTVSASKNGQTSPPSEALQACTCKWTKHNHNKSFPNDVELFI